VQLLVGPFYVLCNWSRRRLKQSKRHLEGLDRARALVGDLLGGHPAGPFELKVMTQAQNRVLSVLDTPPVQGCALAQSIVGSRTVRVEVDRK
jgi:hypothetical protein